MDETVKEFQAELAELKRDYEYMIDRMKKSLSNVKWLMAHFGEVVGARADVREGGVE